MTALHTRPTPIHPEPRTHEHAWVTESRHRTSEGLVIYVRCAACEARRVDVRSPWMPPTALSRCIEREAR